MKNELSCMLTGCLDPTMQAQGIYKLNEETVRYGLTLSSEAALRVVQSHRQTLRETKRLEFGGKTAEKIVDAFKDSSYIHQHNYEATLCQLVETFYYYKNETKDQIGDDRLIEIMRDRFENTCHGSLELLHHKAMDQIVTEQNRGIDHNDTEEVNIERY